MADSDVVYVGIDAAAAALGLHRGKVQRLIADHFLTTTRGESGSAGGRPPHLIRRRALLAAISKFDAWERGQARLKTPPGAAAAPRHTQPRNTRMTKQRRKAMGKMRREFFPFRPKPRVYSRNRLRR